MSSASTTIAHVSDFPAKAVGLVRAVVAGVPLSLTVFIRITLLLSLALSVIVGLILIG